MVQSDIAKDAKSTTNRRAFLRRSGSGSLIAIVGLAGCTGGGGNASGGNASGGNASGGNASGGNASGGNASGPYEVGSAQPLSGTLAQWGSEYNKNGMNLALEYINKEKIKGRKLKFLVQDTQTTPQAGVSAAQKLINQKGVPLIMGSVSSGVALAIAKSVTIPNKTVQVINNATSPKIAELDDNRYVLRTAPNDALEAKVIAKLFEKEGVNKASTLYVNNAYGDALSEQLKKSMKKKGSQLVKQVPYEQGKSTYKPQLNEAMSGDPDALAFLAYPEGFIPMAKEAYEMGIKDKVKYFGDHPLNSGDIKEQNPKIANGMIGVSPSPPIDSDLYKQFKSRYKKKFNKDPASWSAFTYDAVNLIALAIQKADSFESKSLRDAIYPLSRPGGTTVATFKEGKNELKKGNEINYNGVSGNVNLNDAGDVSAVYRKWTYRNKKFHMGEILKA